MSMFVVAFCAHTFITHLKIMFRKIFITQLRNCVMLVTPLGNRKPPPRASSAFNLRSVNVTVFGRFAARWH